ncbi:MAG: LysR substrate-binding domain-containing protein [Protaetiibacter sp.]
METRRLEYFVALVREGSFRRAADALFISQPALSQQIQRLEAEIGAILIDRSVHPFELTPAGRRLLERSQRILDELGEIEGVAARARRGLLGKLRIGVAPSLMYSALPAAIRRFRAAHPDIELTLQRENTSSIIDQLAEQRIDVGLTFSGRGVDGVEFIALYEDSFVAVLPSGHRLAAKPVVRMSELRDETFLMLTRRGVPDLHDAIIAACAQAGFSPRSIETSFQAAGAGYVDQIGLAGAGYGIALIPGAVATLQIEGVVYRNVVRPSIRLPTSLAWNLASRNASIDTFRTFMLEDLATQYHMVETATPPDPLRLRPLRG